MLRPLKRAVRKVIQLTGYDIAKIVTPAPPADAPKCDYPFAGIPYDPNTVSDDVYSRSFPRESLDQAWFFNIGAGTFRHKYWTNVDFSSEWYASQQADQAGSRFINFDLFSLQPLPIANGIAEAVYTSHTVEHVTDEACANMFREAHRILKPGGIFRMTTPDIELDMAAYRRGDRDYFYWIDFYSHPKVCETVKIKPFNMASIQQIVLFNFATHLSQLALATDLPKVSDEEFDHVFRTMSQEDTLNHFSRRCTIEAQRRAPGYHMNWWSETKAVRMLREAGFERIWRSGFGQSHSPAMRDVILFDKQDPKISLYIEAVR